MSKFSLPETFETLPTSIGKIQKLFIQENPSSDTLVLLLEKEPLLCANILKLVNSPHYGLSRKITSVGHALMLLGTTIVRGIIMASVLKKTFGVDLSPYSITLDEFEKICILRSRLLSLWLKGEELEGFTIDLPTLSSAAFLMESGKIILAQEILKNETLVEFKTSTEQNSIEESEDIFFGVNSYEVSAKLFSQWLFAEEFTTLIEGVLRPKTQEQQILHILFILINSKTVMSEASIELALQKARESGFSDTKLLEAIEKIQMELV